MGVKERAHFRKREEKSLPKTYHEHPRDDSVGEGGIKKKTPSPMFSRKLVGGSRA